jgi:hypothetical protein
VERVPTRFDSLTGIATLSGLLSRSLAGRAGPVAADAARPQALASPAALVQEHQRIS